MYIYWPIESSFPSKIEVLFDSREALCLKLKLSLRSLYIIHHFHCIHEASLKPSCAFGVQLKDKLSTSCSWKDDSHR